MFFAEVARDANKRAVGPLPGGVDIWFDLLAADMQMRVIP